MAASSWRALGRFRLLMSAAVNSETAATTTSPASVATATATATAKAGAMNKEVSPEFARKVENLLQGIAKPRRVKPIFQQFLGSTDDVSRCAAMEKVLNYIKENKLQKPENEKIIICDEKLKTIFSGKHTVGFHEIDDLVRQHFVETD